ncbi:MAG: response regulator transcription factor [Candidatus Omnitrophica bacterium]|nr:response regulator transcription factor [Candidatus Omnitrophota bacterium]
MTAGNPQNAVPAGKSILIVDDEQEVREFLESRLTAAGYRVRLAGNGDEAVQTFIRFFYEAPFDVILLDINLPDMDGREILKLFRQEEELRGINYGDGVIIIMQTGGKEHWMDAFNKGCDDYIIKPYSFQDLRNKIEEKLQIKKERSGLK